jgi:hypothetical protein
MPTSLVAGARFQVSTEHIERAAYVLGGQIEIEGQTGSFTKDQLIVFKPGAEMILKGTHRAGLSGLAKRQFPGVPGETEFIPLPDAPSSAPACSSGRQQHAAVP